MNKAENEWFDSVEIDGRRSYSSKFARKDFTVPVKSLRERWSAWTPDERRRFAWAFGFSGKTRLNEEEQQSLEFLMENGDPDVWRAVALVVARHHDQNQALNFLLKRVKEETEHLANYYQALAILSAPECVPILTDKLSTHRREVDLHTSTQGWGESFVYSDYLCCSATLFRITGREEYRDNLRKILEHPDEKIRQKIRTIAAANGFEV